ncbi:MAG: zinc-binding dehydrogenase [Steroidobacteraceae bacterium]|jgi:threonine dehydrogenase-like Zn-dependent dehydrogenase|nr:zinc-binding dehydrogenase [Steroidobacteraceae bacterium]
MKAWRVYGYGDMRLDEVPEPLVRPGWVKIRIRVVQPSITETLLFAGAKTYLHEKVASLISHGPAQLFGHEFSAVVVETGEGVQSLARGDRVAPRGSHPDGIVGFDYPGAFAEYAVVPESLLARLPDHVSDSEAAVIQPLTDAVAGVHAAAMRLGDVVVVIGQGAMGLSCLQVARAAGAGLTIAVAKRDSTLALSRQLGADITINATTCDPVAAVRELTGGIGADVVFEAAGGPVEQGLSGEQTLRQAADMTRDHGKVVGIALQGEGTLLPYAHFRHRGIRYLFPSMFDRRLFETTVRLVASGRVNVRPMVTRVLTGIERVPEAFALTADKAAHGLVNPAQVVIST